MLEFSKRNYHHVPSRRRVSKPFCRIHSIAQMLEAKEEKKNGGKREKEIDCHHDHHFSFFHSFSRISPPGKKKMMRTHVLLPLLLMPRMVSRSLDDRRRSGQASKGLNRMMHACTYYAAWLPTAGGDGGGEQSYYYTVDRSGCTGVIK